MKFINLAAPWAAQASQEDRIAGGEEHSELEAFRLKRPASQRNTYWSYSQSIAYTCAHAD